MFVIYIMSAPNSNPSSLGGGMPGVANKLIGGGANSTSGSGMVGGNGRAMNRFSLKQAWNGQAATGSINNNRRKIGPFRAVNNAGDFLSRKSYVSGGSNQISSRAGASTIGKQSLGGGVQANADNTGVPSSTTNVKYVYDGSDYAKFKRQQAINRNYNDKSFGGSNNSNQVVFSRVRR